ncbi:MAG TPA: SCO family protein, partial [Hanamia sp.]|nr:SCO family protein [Hanamia sp.]
VVGMIFTHCDYACPRLTADMKNMEEKLKEDDGKVNFLLVSFDSKRDTAAQLKKFASGMQLSKNFTLLHGSEEAVRTLSVLLNVQFEKDAEGNFSHSNIISVLDKNGTLRFQKEGLDANHEETINTLHQILQ